MKGSIVAVSLASVAVASILEGPGSIHGRPNSAEELVPKARAVAARDEIPANYPRNEIEARGESSDSDSKKGLGSKIKTGVKEGAHSIKTKITNKFAKTTSTTALPTTTNAPIYGSSSSDCNYDDLTSTASAAYGQSTTTAAAYGQSTSSSAAYGYGTGAAQPASSSSAYGTGAAQPASSSSAYGTGAAKPQSSSSAPVYGYGAGNTAASAKPSSTSSAPYGYGSGAPKSKTKSASAYGTGTTSLAPSSTGSRWTGIFGGGKDKKKDDTDTDSDTNSDTDSGSDSSDDEGKKKGGAGGVVFPYGKKTSSSAFGTGTGAASKTKAAAYGTGTAAPTKSKSSAYATGAAKSTGHGAYGYGSAATTSTKSAPYSSGKKSAAPYSTGVKTSKTRASLRPTGAYDADDESDSDCEDGDVIPVKYANKPSSTVVTYVTSGITVTATVPCDTTSAAKTSGAVVPTGGYYGANKAHPEPETIVYVTNGVTITTTICDETPKGSAPTAPVGGYYGGDNSGAPKTPKAPGSQITPAPVHPDGAKYTTVVYVTNGVTLTSTIPCEPTDAPGSNHPAGGAPAPGPYGNNNNVPAGGAPAPAPGAPKNAPAPGPNAGNNVPAGGAPAPGAPKNVPAGGAPAPDAPKNVPAGGAPPSNGLPKGPAGEAPPVLGAAKPPAEVTPKPNGGNAPYPVGPTAVKTLTTSASGYAKPSTGPSAPPKQPTVTAGASRLVGTTGAAVVAVAAAFMWM